MGHWARTDIFHALSTPTRRGIVELLSRNGRMSAMDIGHSFRVSPPAISQHLKVLLEADIVDMERDGRSRLYSINPEAMIGIEEWARKTRHEWNRRFDALEALNSSRS